jgi:hypothetical protein
LNRNFSYSYEQLIYNQSKKSIVDNFINNHYFLYLFFIFHLFFDLSFHNIFHNDILWNIFYDKSTKNLLWKYFKFIRSSIKIDSWWSIVDHFFVINNQSKKLNTATLISPLYISILHFYHHFGGIFTETYIQNR